MPCGAAFLWVRASTWAGRILCFDNSSVCGKDLVCGINSRHPPCGFGYCPFWGYGAVVVDQLIIFAPIVFVKVSCVWSLFCCAVFDVSYSFAIISLGKRELVALL